MVVSDVTTYMMKYVFVLQQLVIYIFADIALASGSNKM